MIMWLMLAPSMHCTLAYNKRIVFLYCGSHQLLVMVRFKITVNAGTGDSIRVYVGFSTSRCGQG